MAEINVGQISEALNDKLDRDCINVEADQEILSNTDFTNINSSQTVLAKTDFTNVGITGKTLAVRWGMPDYTASKHVTLDGQGSYTAPEDGYFYGTWEINNTFADVTVNGVRVSVIGDSATGNTVQMYN